MTVSFQQYIDRLTGCNLMSSDDIKVLVDRFPDDKIHNGEELARWAVEESKLTAYQAQQILVGDGHRLVMGNYVVMDKVGQGGMGVVLKAEHKRMHRVVALKMLSPADTNSPDAVARFHREVEAAAKLEHPNIVTAYDADEVNGSHFMVMQFVEGVDLNEFVLNKGALSVDKAIHCIVQTACGLQYAHEKGVIHRDIKPSNLLLDNEGTVKVLDMGLARLEGTDDHPRKTELTHTGNIMGTADFMAPEQARSTKDADARSDIYSLGITLWFLITGKIAFAGDSLTARLLAHQQMPAPSLSESCSDVSEDLESVFQKMVAKNPNERFQTMNEVIEALENCLTHSVSAPSLSAASSEASKLHRLLKESREQPERESDTGKLSEQPLPPKPIAETINIDAAEVDTDARLFPATELLPNPHRIAKSNRTRMLWIVGVAGVLLITALSSVFFVKRSEMTAIKDVGSDQQLEQIVIGLEKELQNDRSVTTGETETSSPSSRKLTSAPSPAIAPFSSAKAKVHQQNWANYLGLPVDFTNSRGMKFVLIPPGRFTMGSTPEEIESAPGFAEEGGWWKLCALSESPQHTVVLTEPFYLGTCEVTQSEYLELMGVNPSSFSSEGISNELVAGLDTSRFPVESVNWVDAVKFCHKLSQQEGLERLGLQQEDARKSKVFGYRLPTEAEWEFACRAGTTTLFWCGDDIAGLNAVAWNGANCDARIHQVGELKANPFGLFDIHGNAWEWVADYYDEKYYEQFDDQPVIDPTGPHKGTPWRSVRGGFWGTPEERCSSGRRYGQGPNEAYGHNGFRLALSVDAVLQLSATKTGN